MKQLITKLIKVGSPKSEDRRPNLLPTSNFPHFSTEKINPNFSRALFIASFLFFATNNLFAALSFNGATVNSAQTICSGSTPAALTLTIATCTGTNLYAISAYEWQESDDNGVADAWAVAVGGTVAPTSSYTPRALTAAIYYRCKITVSNLCVGVVSPYYTAAVKITVNKSTSITSNPSNKSVCSGSLANFSVGATGSSLTYKWQSSTGATGTYTNITGATNAAYSVTGSTSNNGTYYKCVVSGSCGAATSSYAKLSLNTATSITSQPANQTVCAGSSAAFSVTASGTGTLTYQWQKSTDGTNFSNVSTGSGDKSANYTFKTSTTDNNSYYQCKVSGTCGSAITSSAANLTINTLPTITIQPVPSQIVYSGNVVNLSISASGSGLSYQWKKSTSPGGSNFANISDATGSIYSFVAASTDNGYNYQCVVSGTCSPSVTSNTSNLIVQTMATVAGNYSYLLSSTGTTYTKTTSLLSTTPPDVYINLNNRATDKNQKVPGVSYSYNELSSSTSKIFYNDFMYKCLIGSGGTSSGSCFSKSLNSLKLVAVLNTGDVDNLGSLSNYNASVTITVKDPSTSSLNQSISLSINQNSPEQLFQLELDPSKILEFSQANVTISSITTTSTSSSLLASLKNNLQLKIYFAIDYGIDVTNKDAINSTAVSSPVSNNPITLNWTSTTTCTENIPTYEIQILRLYNINTDYADNGYKIKAPVDWSQAFAIQTPDNSTSFKLSLTEGSGYYIWRVRAIGNYYDGGFGNSQNYGNWNAESPANGDTITLTNSSLTLSLAQTKYLFYYNQFDADKNWIYNRVMTEDAKISEGISFADGLGLPRQSQRKLQEQNQILANQTLYDYVGRPAVSTMTAPIDQTKLGFVGTLVTDKNGNLYGPDDFDSDGRITKPRYPECAGADVDVPIWENAQEMFGPINDYYSNKDTVLSIPNAENYPFSRTVYDKLGRAKKTSLFGAEHHMGLYDETYMLGGLQRTIRTYYSSVNDSELMKVFGNETPSDSLGVYKIVKVDPNEVPTVEYKTNDGKTIATCMVNTGDHPLLDDISESNNTITKLIKGNRKADSYTLVKEQVLTFTDPTIQLDVDYILHKDEFEANCINYCSTCDYIIDLYVIREETDEIKWEYKDTITPGDCDGNLVYNPDDTSASVSMAASYDTSCPQLVLGENIDSDPSVIMLSDPGNYRIGRRITVNSKYDGEARYRDYHTDTLNALLDIEASKFDTLLSLINDTTGSLSALYNYLDNITHGTSSACDDETDESGISNYDFANRFTSSIDQAFGGTGVSTKNVVTSGSPDISIPSNGTSSASQPNTQDVWVVSYDSTETSEGYEGTYTVASSCLEIQIPKIPCDWSPCDNLWVTKESLEASGTKDADMAKWQTDLFSAHGGYYDFESILIDKWKNETNDYTGKQYGTKLYKYFYDRNGNYKYPANIGDEAKLVFTCDDDHAHLAEYSGTTKISDKTHITFKENGTKIFDQDINVVYDHDVTTKYTTDNFAYLEDYVKSVASALDAALSPYGYQVRATGSGTLWYVEIEQDFSITGTSLTHSVAITDDGNTYLNAYLMYSATDNGFYRTEDTDFPYGNGAFNSMITHMIMAKDDDSETDHYNCYDLYIIWQDIVNNYDALYAGFAPNARPGIDLLEYFLSLTGKRYTGFSKESYGKETIDVSSDYSRSANGKRYGYLEYAYKSFPFIYSSILSDQQKNCLDIAGIINGATDNTIKNTNTINTWANPDNWGTSACGTYAWYNPATGKGIADEFDENDTCKAWSMLQACLNSDLDLYADSLSEDLPHCDNSPGSECINEMDTLIKLRALDVMYKRLLGVANIIQLRDGVSQSEASDYALALYDVLTKDFDLTVQKIGSKITGVGTSDQLASIYDFGNRGITVDGITPTSIVSNYSIAHMPSGYKYVPSTSKKTSEILNEELNYKFRSSEHVSTSELKSAVNEICDRHAWDKTQMTAKLSANVSTSTNTSYSRQASASRLTFTANAGTITLHNLTDVNGDALDFTIAGFGTDDPIHLTNSFAYTWGNTMAEVVNPTALKVVSEECDPRNLTYLTDQINYNLDQAKDCRLQKSLEEYDTHCSLPKNINDTLKVSYSVDYHQYTLYYYDLAGNLVEVVPPKGVDVFNYDTNNDGVNDAFPSRQDVKNHTLTTQYRYNSIGQRTYENTPDGGTKHFVYNSIGQLRFAQNEKQVAANVYEYYKYDALGRLIEAGLSSQDITDATYKSSKNIMDYPTTNLTDRMISVYGTGSTTGLKGYLGKNVNKQTYLENRIQYAYNDPDGIANNGDEAYTYYSYDPHGNVQWMGDSIPGGLAMKYIYYKYDLLTGKVKEVRYNEGMKDQFFHRFSYDSDNRVIAVETSRDGVIWDVDAKYQYYAYGPMKRLSVGEDNVQGLDYVYTINGWLKAINHQSLSSTYDPGADGTASSGYAQDAFGMSLGYFNGDFKRYTDKNKNGVKDAGETSSPFNSEFNTTSSEYYYTGKNQLAWDYDNADRYTTSIDGGIDNTKAFNYRPLFNGSITNVAYATQACGDANVKYDGQIKGFKYTYDELYRLTQSNFDYYDGSKWMRNSMQNTIAPLTDYNTSYSYDLMGNITHLARYGANGTTGSSPTSSTKMDTLSYTYVDKNGDGIADNNKLSKINDKVTDYNYAYDLENQNPNNYSYDEIGELTGDAAEGIQSITWTRTGKAKVVTKETTITSGTYTGAITHKQITFYYDALDNRVLKIVSTSYKKGSYTGTLPASTWENTNYILDANGKEMSTYTINSSGTTQLSEEPIYAGERIGMVKPNTSISWNINENAAITHLYTRTLKNKDYELKDYLGNVRAVVNDAKEVNSDGTYRANLLSSSDYYPYGMVMPKSDYSSSDYRYGYQGMEKDNEIKDGGNSYDFGARFLDPRVGRWLSLDPKAEKFPSESPYSAMANNSINYVDPDGKEPEFFLKLTLKGGPTAGVKFKIFSQGAEVKVGGGIDIVGLEVVANSQGTFINYTLANGKTTTIDFKAEYQVKVLGIKQKGSSGFSIDQQWAVKKLKSSQQSISEEIKDGSETVSGSVKVPIPLPEEIPISVEAKIGIRNTEHPVTSSNVNDIPEAAETKVQCTSDTWANYFYAPFASAFGQAPAPRCGTTQDQPAWKEGKSNEQITETHDEAEAIRQRERRDCDNSGAAPGVCDQFGPK